MIKQELQQGFKDAFPVVLGYFPLGFAFGVLAQDCLLYTSRCV